MKKAFLLFLSFLLIASFACTKPDAPAEAQQPAVTEAPAKPANQTEAPAVTAEPEPAEPEPTPDPSPEPPPEAEPLPEQYLPLSERLQGEWYADCEGLMILFNLAEDGTYALTIPGGDPLNGTWETKDGLLILDGDEENPLLPVNGVIRMETLDLLFTREQPEVFQPGAPVADVKEGSFDGYWKSCYTAVGEGTIRSEAIAEDTEIYIEGIKLATNGSLLPLAQYDCTIENGLLTFASEQGQVTLQLLEGGFLRLSLDNEIPGVIYLARMPVPDQAAAENP